MDRATRNSLERATQRARSVLEEDFASQLEGTYGILASGAVSSSESVRLGNGDASTHNAIVAALERKRAGGASDAHSVAEYLRDAAFTTLNRFVALKMLEARNLVQQCVSLGAESSGYAEFVGMATGLTLLPEGRGYRLYIESLFDELSMEVKVLFDRRDPAAALWPRRPALAGLLAVLNDPTLNSVWSADETIGWVYQYFNSDDERKAMRSASQAPRTSYELAVRNQFFTPHYVVRFLTDNTLGRIWFEMCDGETALSGRCDHLVRHPDEADEARPRKDPRDIRVLDPACGSGHFLLYAFDLFLVIYEEAWADPDSPPSAVTSRTLRDDFPSLETLRESVPGLILLYNLHGVDIDARCAQIAQLALWMRAQRAYHEKSIVRGERPVIRRANVVVAEPMPGDPDLLAEFLRDLEDPLLVAHFQEIVAQMRLAGLLGLLLRTEELVTSRGREGHTGNLFAPSEGRIRSALERFARQADVLNQARRRLFIDDAVQGLGLIALADTRFDVVLMNPPFGDAPTPVRRALETNYPTSWKDLFQAFVERALELAPDGLVGALGPRTSLFLTNGESWRRAFLVNTARLTALADLGIGVLDGAKIEVAAYVVGRTKKRAVFLRALKLFDKDVALARLSRCGPADVDNRLVFFRDPRSFDALPGSAFAYWVSPAFLELFKSLPATEGTIGAARVGLQTSDDFRFLRLRWEVQSGTASNAWALFAKGGEYSPFYSDVHLVVQWQSDGREVCAFNEERYGSATRNVRSKDRYFEPGVTWSPRTTTEFAPRLLPRSCIFGQKGPTLLVETAEQGAWALAVMNSRVYQYLLTVGAGAADIDPGSISKSYGVGLIQSLPVPTRSSASAAAAAVSCWKLRRMIAARLDTTSAYFLGLPAPAADRTVASWLASLCSELLEAECAMLDSWTELSSQVADSYALAPEHVKEVDDEVGALLRPSLFEARAQDDDDAEGEEYSAGRLSPGGWGYVRRNARRSGRSPREVVDALEDLPRNTAMLRPFAGEALEYYFGSGFGVWTRVSAPWAPGDEDVFGEIPPWPPARGPAPSAILVDDPGHWADVGTRVLAAAEQDWPSCASETLNELVALASDESSASAYIAKRFFSDHLSRFSRSRRKAPIYWQIATPSAAYSVWLYANALSADTLYRVQNEFLEPKLRHEERKLEALRSERDSARHPDQRGALASQEVLVEELRSFLTEVRVVTPLWKPHQDDGTVINFAPLWRLVGHNKVWQRELKGTWESLCAGEYDWAHIAMDLWPERIVPKCATDRSLAIAHGLEDVFWTERPDGRWTARPLPSRPIDDLIAERTSAAVKAALTELHSAPMGVPARAARNRSNRKSV